MIATLARQLARRSPRERLLLALLLLGALPLAFVVLLALPLLESRAAAGADLAAARATQAWYSARQAEIAALPDPRAAPSDAARVVPVGLGGIEARLIAAGLRPAVTLLANAPNGRVALSLQAVAFADLMPWIDGIDAAGYGVAALMIERSAPGVVDAELQLEPLR
ncbi:type II secretion system protein GspM [Pararhodobacter aggregans]|uniref:type II secretion system protein GspM n=1 Tax=Pararhodobacter aggregans TaxID=404875 RepID=UPI003A92543B